MSDNKVFSCIGLFIYAIFIAIVGYGMKGWALAVLWGWFIVPFGLPALTIVQAIGVAIVVSHLTHQAQDKDSDKIKDKEALDVMVEATVSVVIPPLTAVFLGWIVYQFMV